MLMMKKNLFFIIYPVLARVSQGPTALGAKILRDHRAPW